MNPPTGALSKLWVHFYDDDSQKPFTPWTQYMLETASLARRAAKAAYHHYPMRTYAVGTSNGGYQVRRAMETAPDLFDGGVDWEGTYISPTENILVDLPPAIRNFPDYLAANYDPDSTAAQNILAAGYPPDMVQRDGSGNVTASLWRNYYIDFWEVTACPARPRWMHRARATTTSARRNTGCRRCRTGTTSKRMPMCSPSCARSSATRSTPSTCLSPTSRRKRRCRRVSAFRRTGRSPSSRPRQGIARTCSRPDRSRGRRLGEPLSNQLYEPTAFPAPSCVGAGKALRVAKLRVTTTLADEAGLRCGSKRSNSAFTTA